MNDNLITTVFKELGLKNLITGMDDLHRIMLLLNTVSADKMLANLDAISKKLNITKESSVALINKLKEGFNDPVAQKEAGVKNKKGFVQKARLKLEDRGFNEESQAFLEKTDFMVDVRPKLDEKRIKDLDTAIANHKFIGYIKLDKEDVIQDFKKINERISTLPVDVRQDAFKQLLNAYHQKYKLEQQSTTEISKQIALAKQYEKTFKGQSTPLLQRAGLMDKDFKSTSKKTQIREMEKLTDQYGRFGEAQSKTTQESQKAEKATDKQITKQKQLDKNIGVAIGKLIRYRVAFYAMRGAIDAVKDSLTSFIDFQSGLAELEKVIDKQSDSMKKYREETFTLAKTFGGTIKDIIGGMKIWAQTGLKQNEVLEATRATLIGVNALGGDTKQITEALTAAIFSYKVEAEDLVQVLSKWMAVQREFPITANDLANSLKIVGAAARIVGVDLDDLAGYVAAIGAATRKSGQAVGQSLKTMFARLPREKVIKVFETLNIGVLKSATELRDLDDVLADLSKQWGTMNTVAKANLAVTLGGIRRYADFVALMDNYETKLAATIIAQRANTEALEGADITLNTFKKSWEKTSASITQFSVSVGEVLTGPLSGLMSVFSSLLSSFNSTESSSVKVTASIISFVTVASALGVALAALKFILSKTVGFVLAEGSAAFLASKGNEKLGWSAIFSGNAFKKMTISIKASTIASWKFLTSLTAIKAGFIRLILGAKGVVASLGAMNSIMLALSIAAGIAAVFWTKMSDSASKTSIAFNNNSKSSEQIIKSMKNQIDALEKEITLFEILPGKIEKTLDSLKKAKVGTTEYLVSTEKLHQLFNNITGDYQEINDAVLEYNKHQDDGIEITKKIVSLIRTQATLNKEAVKDKKDLLQAEKDLRILELQGERTKLIGKLDGLDEFAKTLGAIKKNIPKEISFPEIKGLLSAKEINKARKEATSAFGYQFDVGAFRKTLRELQKKVDESGVSVKQTLESSLKGENFENVFKIAVQDYKEAINNSGFREASKSLSTMFPDLAELVSIDEDVLKDYFGSLEKSYNLLLKEFKVDDISELSKNDKDSFDTRLIKIVKNAEISISDIVDLSKKVESVKGSFSNNLSDIETSIVDLQTVFNKPKDGQFFISTKHSQSVLAVAEALETLEKNIDSADKRFQHLSEKLKYGEFLSKEDFDGTEAIKTIDSINNTLLKLRQTMATNKSDTEAITKALESLKASGLKAGDIVEIGDIDLKKQLSQVEGLRKAVEQLALGSKQPYDKLIAYQIELQQELITLNQLMENKTWTKELELQRDALAKYNKLTKDSIMLQAKLNTSFEPQISGLDSQIRILSNFKGTEEKIIKLEREKLKLSQEHEKAIADAKTGTERLQALEGLRKKHLKENLVLMTKERDIRLDIVLKKAAENAQVLKNTLSDAFSNIPTNLLEGAEKRKELTEELRVAEFEMQEARSEGDANSIKQAQYRVDMIKHEMDEYKSGWTEIKRLIGDVFGNIASSFWKQLSDQVATNLANITIGGKSLGDSVGDAMTDVTTNFTKGWRITAESINTTHMNDLKSALQSHVDQLRILFSKQTTGVSQSLSVKDFEKSFNFINKETSNLYKKDIDPLKSATFINDETKTSIDNWKNSIDENTFALHKTLPGALDKTPAKELTDVEKTIKSAGILTAGAIATGITGTKNKGANIGSQFGTMAGANLGNPGALLGGLGILGGPIGALAGGLLGGLVGGLFGGKDKPQEPLNRSLDANTDATINNTIALKELDKAIFNAPTRYNVPIESGSFGRAITININGDDSNTIAQKVREALNDDFNDDVQSYGTRGYVPV